MIDVRGIQAREEEANKKYLANLIATAPSTPKLPKRTLTTSEATPTRVTKKPTTIIEGTYDGISEAELEAMIE